MAATPVFLNVRSCYEIHKKRISRSGARAARVPRKRAVEASCHDVCET